MGRKSKRGKIVPYFTNGNEKRNLNVVRSYGIYWGQIIKSSCTNIYFLCKSCVAAVSFLTSKARTTTCVPSLPLASSHSIAWSRPTKRVPWGVRFSCRHSRLTQAAHVENPPLFSSALLLASRPSMDPAAGPTEPMAWPLGHRSCCGR